MSEVETNAEIDYDMMCRVARQRASTLPPSASVDWRDLAQEAALHGLTGRKSIGGPMQDLLRKRIVGNARNVVLGLVELDTVSPILKDDDADPEAVSITNEVVRQIIYDPVLSARERRLLKALSKDNASLKELARRRHVTPPRIGHILTRIRTKLQNRTPLHHLYIERGLSCEKIAKLLGTHGEKVRRSLKAFGIKRRPTTMRPVHCAECSKPIYKLCRCKFHFGQWEHERSVRRWANHVAKRGPVASEARSASAKRVWELRRERYGTRGGNRTGPRPWSQEYAAEA